MKKIIILLTLILTVFSVNFYSAQDSDGDGILNTVDLDDDNDGILDSNEGLNCATFTSAGTLNITKLQGTGSVSGINENDIYLFSSYLTGSNGSVYDLVFEVLDLSPGVTAATFNTTSILLNVQAVNNPYIRYRVHFVLLQQPILREQPLQFLI